MLKSLLFSLFSIINTSLVQGNRLETKINNILDTEYETNVIPVKQLDHPIYLKFGIKLKSIDYFDQVNENMYMRVDLVQSWTDEYLGWNMSDYPNPYIELDSNKIWKPDLELYNAGRKPQVFNENSNVKIYNDGHIEWTRTLIYSFSCPLELTRFPFDTQSCSMTFGSWKFDTRYLDIKLFSDRDSFSSFIVDDDFSHNEWQIINIDSSSQDIEYLCCKDILWSVITFDINLKRQFSSYINNMIMIGVLTLSAIVISLFNPSLYRRTFVLVFIPLSIIWIQIDISDKIPVIEYRTTLENYYMLCFAITNILALESGLVYASLTFSNQSKHTIEKLQDVKLEKEQKIINDYVSRQLDKFNSNNTDTIFVFEDNMIKEYNINIHNIRNTIIKFDSYFTAILPILYFISVIAILYN